MQADKYDYGDAWRFLQSHGWTMSPLDTGIKGTALCWAKSKKIYVRPAVFKAPNLRVRKYVIPHEIWHALHAEIVNYECTELIEARNLNTPSALEVVADGGCWYANKSRAMRLWVRASVAWHGRVGYKYRWADLVSPQAVAMIRVLDQHVRQWRDSQPK